MSAYTVNLKLFPSKPLPFFKKRQVVLLRKNLLKSITHLRLHNSYILRLTISIIFIFLVFLFHLAFATNDQSVPVVPRASISSQKTFPHVSLGSIPAEKNDTEQSNSEEKLPVINIQTIQPTSIPANPPAPAQTSQPSTSPTSAPQQNPVESLFDTTKGMLHNLLGT